MNKRAIITHLLIIHFFMSFSLHASSSEEVDQRIGEQSDLITIKPDQLDRLYHDVHKEHLLAVKMLIKARKEHFRGCSKGFKKLGALGAGLIQGAVGAIGTGIFVAAETVVLDLSYFGVNLKGPLEDPYEHTKQVANETNEVVSVPFNGHSDKKCAELKKLIKESAERQEESYKRYVEIKDAISKVQNISQVPRAEIKDEYVHNVTFKASGSDSDKKRDIARSR